MKKLVLIAFVLLFSSVLGVTQITNLHVKTPVYLDQYLTVNGTYTDTTDANAVLCKFETRDLNSISIERASDEWTFSDGNFYSQVKITDNLYKIDTNYFILVTCGLVTVQNQFRVMNREPLEDIIFNWYSFSLDGSNILPLIFILIFLGAIVVVWFMFKRRP